MIGKTQPLNPMLRRSRTFSSFYASVVLAVILSILVGVPIFAGFYAGFQDEHLIEPTPGLKTYEFHLNDGTRCLMVKGGGLDCDWRIVGGGK